MSCHDSTENKNEVAKIVDEMLLNEDHPNTEILIYFDEEDEDWTITRTIKLNGHNIK
ncbi:hypothetical protein [Paenibacillus medicaginis]|uniref:Uncharacterized protein n=1 Tax=Paenibacillus medicaginis TaxID=1470560 RepID=A0ABV5BV11_9BACL